MELARLHVEARGHIQRNDGQTRFETVVQELPRPPPRSAMLVVAEEGVHDGPVIVVDHGGQYWHAQFPQGPEVVGRDLAHLHGGDDSRRIHALVVQVPSRDQAPSTIVPWTDQDRHPRGVVQLDAELSQYTSSVLHHLQEEDAELLDHEPVHLPHLLDGYRGDVHGLQVHLERLLWVFDPLKGLVYPEPGLGNTRGAERPQQILSAIPVSERVRNG